MPKTPDGKDLWPNDERVTVRHLQAATDRSEKWAMLTSYDALTAQIFESAGVPVLLVGDSAAMVVYGHDTTVPATVDTMLPLVQAVVRGTNTCMVIADLPFGSYQLDEAQALATATRFMQEGGAHAVKLEGGRTVMPQVAKLVDAGIPVMGHLGLTPQSVHAMGGMKQVRGRGSSGEEILRDAKSLESAGAFAVVLEAVPATLGKEIAETLTIPVVGIGAGLEVDAHVLVWQDMAGLTSEPHPRFVRTYADLRSTLTEATRAYVNDVRSGAYPNDSESY